MAKFTRVTPNDPSPSRRSSPPPDDSSPSWEGSDRKFAALAIAAARNALPPPVPSSIPCLAKRELPVTIESRLTMIMELDDRCLACFYPNWSAAAETSSGHKRRGNTDEDTFLRKYELLDKDELSAALMVNMQEVQETLAQEVSCVGCRRSVEELCKNVGGGAESALEPLVISADSVVSVDKEHARRPRSLANLFCYQLQRLKSCYEESQPKNAKKSGRCTNHTIAVKKPSPIIVWAEVWKFMELECQEAVLRIPFAIVRETIDRYLKKHSFCSECSNMVNQAYQLLIQESANDPNKCDEIAHGTREIALREAKAAKISEEEALKVARLTATMIERVAVPKVKSNLYDGIRACSDDQSLNLNFDLNLVGRLMNMAEPELVGQKQERHAKTIEIAQKEILTCIGITLYERFQRISQKLREGELCCDILFLVALRTLKKSFDLAVEKKQGFTDLDRLISELNDQETVDKMRAQRKKEKKVKQNEKKKQFKKEKENNHHQQQEMQQQQQEQTAKAILVSSSSNQTSAAATCNASGDAKKQTSKTNKKQPKPKKSAEAAVQQQATNPQQQSCPPKANFDDSFSILLDQMYRQQQQGNGYQDEGDEALDAEESIPAEEIESFLERQSLVNQERERKRAEHKKKWAKLCANGFQQVF